MEWTVLSGVPDDQRQLVLRAATRRRFRKGDTLFYEGDLGDTLHLIEKGFVAVRVTTRRGDVVTLDVYGPGEAVGELALVLPAARRTACVVALEPTETRMLDRAAFEDLCRRHPQVQAVMMQILATKIERQGQLLAQALHEAADDRVRRHVVRLAEMFADHESARIPLTQEDIASMAGTTRPTVNKVLREMEDAGLVVLGRGRVEVPDRTRLAKLVR
ncbi:MAG TPA: Crp/Fnr family transcriptional regulator [Acidimicrobiales bacterium]